MRIILDSFLIQSNEVRVSAGDSTHLQLVSLLYRDHRDWLLGWLRKSLYSPERAEDLSQDTFVRLLARRDLDQTRAPRAEEQAMALDALREIDRLLGQLSSNARAAFLHNRLDGMGHVEIAERLGVSVSRVRQYLAQGLRQCYIALYGEPQ